MGVVLLLFLLCACSQVIQQRSADETKKAVADSLIELANKALTVKKTPGQALPHTGGTGTSTTLPARATAIRT